MISRKNILLIMVLCLAIVLSACTLPSPTPGLPAPARSTQLYVSTSGNDSNDCLSEAGPCLTVHSAVTKAEPYSIIHIGPGEFLEVQDNHTNSSLTLIGAGRDQTIIRHARYGVVFQVNSTEGYLTIQDLTIGSSGGEGWRDGIVVHIGAHVLIENCRVTENQIGVGIAENGSATINNSVIEGNASGIDNRGHLEMSNTTLQHNAEGTIAGLISGPALS